MISSRWLLGALLAAWVLAISAGASGQDALALDRLGAPFGAEWAHSEGPPTARVGPRLGRRPSAPLIALGAALLTVGYGGSLAIGIDNHRLRAGAIDCRAGYADDHFVPIGGAAAGFARAVDCLQVALAWMVLDVVSTVLQLGGVVALLVGGLVGQARVELGGAVDVEIAPWAGPEGGGVALGGTFE